MSLGSEKPVTRERLLGAAIELFAHSGFEATSVADICARAGANIAAVNYYFGDKKALFREAVFTSAQRMEECYPFPDDLDRMEPASKVETFVELLLNRACGELETGVHPGDLLKDLSLSNEMFVDIKREFLEPRFIQFTGILSEYFGNHATEDDVHTTAMLCVVVCTSIRAACSRNEPLFFSFQGKEDMDQIKEFLLGGIQAKKKEIESREKETIL